MTNISKDDFIAGLKKSGLLDSKQLGEFLAGLKEDSAQAVAKKLVREKLATRWQAKYLLSGRSRLDIGSYRLLERINRDEFGDRFLGVHTSLARKVDIQVLPGSLTKDPASREAFIQKASMAAKLDHPNLTHVYDIDQEGGRYFLVTEHVEGTTIDQADRETLAEANIARIINQAIKGISYAHQNNVVHGCISPTDLVLDDNQQIKIQHLPLSPLRQQASGTNGTPMSELDFSALAKIGNDLLTSSEAVDPARRAKLKIAFDNLNTGTSNSVKLATRSLAEIDDATEDPSSDQMSVEVFSGGFDQPIASNNAPRKKDKSGDAPAEESSDEEPVEAGYIGRLWRDNPVALIATSVVLAVMIVGGSIFGAIQIVGGQNPDGPKLTTGNTKQLKQDPKLRIDQKTQEPKDGSPPGLTDEQMESFLDDRFDNPKKNQKGPKKKPGNKSNNKPATQDEKTETLTNAQPPIKPNGQVVENNDPAPKEQSPSEQSPTDPTAKDPGAAASTPPATETVPPQPLHEDLTVISGIADATQKILQAGGVKSLETLASLSPEEIRAAIRRGGWANANKLEEYKGWITQAKKEIGDETPMSTNPVVEENPTPDIDDTPKPNPAGPFEKFPRTTELPPIEDLTEIKIGDLVIKAQHLLGAELKCEEGFAKGRTLFELERTSDDKQKWLVGLKKTDKHDPIHIGEFRKSEDALYFRWLPAAAQDKTAEKLAPFLANCFLKLELPGDQTTFVTLRRPVKIPDLRLTQNAITNRIEIEIPAMPKAETIVVEVLPMAIPNVETNIPNSRVERNMPATIWLKKQDKSGFLWIQVAGDLRSKLKLQSNLMLLVQGQPQPVGNLSDLDDLARTINSAAGLAQRRHDQFSKPASMSKGDFDKQKAEFLKIANAQNKLKDQIIQYEQIVPKILDQPIKVRIYAKLGNMQIMLAVTDPSLPQEDDKK